MSKKRILTPEEKRKQEIADEVVTVVLPIVNG